MEAHRNALFRRVGENGVTTHTAAEMFGRDKPAASPVPMPRPLPIGSGLASAPTVAAVVQQPAGDAAPGEQE